MAVVKKLNAFQKRRERNKKLAEQFLTLSEEEKLGYVRYSYGCPTEFEIQSHLYQTLLNMGYKARGEILSMCGSCKFDVVVFDNDEKPIRIIEVKKHKKGVSFGDRKTRQTIKKSRKEQLTRYSRFGVKIDVVNAMSGANEYIKQLIANGGFLHNHRPSLPTDGCADLGGSTPATSS